MIATGQYFQNNPGGDNIYMEDDRNGIFFFQILSIFNQHIELNLKLVTNFFPQILVTDEDEDDDEIEEEDDAPNNHAIGTIDVC